MGGETDRQTDRREATLNACSLMRRDMINDRRITHTSFRLVGGGTIFVEFV